MKPKLKSSVSVVRINETILEFFKTNTREQVRLKLSDDNILNIVSSLVSSLDGEKNIDEIANEFKIDEDSLVKLLEYLLKKGILDCVSPQSDFIEYEKFRRVINFLSDFSYSHENLVEYWENIRNSRVLIIGLGAVGTWVASNLVQSGVQSLVLMDNDIVEVSNLHRQFGYNEKSIGQKKIDVLNQHLVKYNPNLEVLKFDKFLDGDVLSLLDDIKIDLIINCADKPNVDTTSLWVGEYGMKRNIPHIVGGGYNLHLSLIGQTVIPNKSACVKCFEKQLEEDNSIDSTRVKKLVVKNRKVGSFGPMCAIIASQIGMESIKVLSKCIMPANINRRGEFDIYTMNITYKNFLKREDCDWCGKHGKYIN